VNRPSEDEIAAWYPRLLRTALRLTGSPDDASDLTQQAFCRAIGAWDSFDGAAQPTTWLHRILVNGIRDWARRRAVRSVEQLDEWDLVPARTTPAENADVEGREELASLRRAVDGLSPPLRQAVVATLIDGYSYQEAADLLNVPRGTVASRVHEARAQLRAVLGGRMGEA